MGYDDAPNFCPAFQHTIELVGRRWTGAILRALLGGPSRFSDLRREVPGLTDRLLADRLEELEHELMVERRVDGEAITYALTDRGEDLRSVIEAVGQFAERWVDPTELPQRPGRRSITAPTVAGGGCPTALSTSAEHGE